MEEYWTVSNGKATRTGFSCRECKKVILKDEPIVCRDGRKMRFFYHQMCFSGDSDPRTQTHNSTDKWKKEEKKVGNNIITGTVAPKTKGYGKWHTSSYGLNSSANVLRNNSQSIKQSTSNNSLPKISKVESK